MPGHPAIAAILIAACISGCTAQSLLSQALFLGNVTNATREDCIWRRGNDRDNCPDPDVKYYMYTSKALSQRKQVDVTGADWLRANGWEPNDDSVVLIHGYGGMDGSFPMVVLRDAYLKNGSYNVFVVDWGPLCKPPCYASAVHNLRPVARCVSELFTFLRNSGASLQRTTCVGHSLGAHMCGLVSLYLLFRMHRIIALDPARPLVRASNRLRSVDANVVQVIHTNAGQFGEGGRLGIVDFCINGGREQPSCENRTHVALCSHVRAVCYMAESINTATARIAAPCSTRRCPSGSRRPGALLGLGVPIIMGQHTPDSAAGAFCVSNFDEPYCPSHPGAPGDVRCCNKQTQNLQDLK
ncbi:phospholipase A1-like [Periplaneta americana]|uniref:phospholipase A1-like n=1 Tax=Periplaneta americana TaxID=6978 RepID=UPI0037E8DBA7